jgi:hypothetical protein
MWSGRVRGVQEAKAMNDDMTKGERANCPSGEVEGLSTQRVKKPCEYTSREKGIAAALDLFTSRKRFHMLKQKLATKGSL